MRTPLICQLLFFIVVIVVVNSLRFPCTVHAATRGLLARTHRIVHRAAFVATFGCFTSVTLLVPTTAVEAVTSSPQQLFEANCSGCHSGGGNVLESNKNLQKKALEKYQYNKIENVEEIIEKGKGRMPAYGEFISQVGNTIPAKLSSSEIKEVAAYVLDEAEKGWPVDELKNTGKNCDVYPGC